jgi:nitrilase
MPDDGSTRAAIVQHPPVLLDRTATTAAAVARLHEAADGGASLVAFPEAFVPGYPAWIWNLRPGGDYSASSELHERLLANAVDLVAGDLQPLQEAAAARQATVVVGIHERDGEFSRGTLYNTLVTIGPDGRLLNRHRKLVPTNPERMVWGQGDASGLRVVDTEAGRLGGLICWESYMPLARFALYAEGVEVYVASTWDSGDTWLATMRHIAAEGRCWVLGSGCALHTDDLTDAVPDRQRIWPEPGWINPGDSVVVAPGGRPVAGPLHESHGILFAEIDPQRAAADRRTLDAAGHYGRPEVFDLRIDRRRRVPAAFIDDDPASGSGSPEEPAR